MNNPEDVPVNAADEIAWLKRYKLETGLSWKVLAAQSDIPHGTLSTLQNIDNYQGNLEVQARRIMEFRQKVESQKQRTRTALRSPKFIETPTARTLMALFEIAHMGRITVAAMGPGTGKTISARHYAASTRPTYLATMRQSTRTVSSMMDQVARAMSLQIPNSWVQMKSNAIINKVKDTGALLIIDEANHLCWEALEELRGWYDEADLGICLLGNEELVLRIRGGARSHQYARLASRIANSHEQDTPTEADTDTFMDEFDIDEGAIRKTLRAIATQPGHGGLREVRQILEAANMLAIAEDGMLEIKHVEAAIKSRATIQRRRSA